MEEEKNLIEELQERPEAFDENKFSELCDRLRSGEETLSFSAIKNFIPPYGSPRMFMAYKLKLKKTTPAMMLGDMIDCALLTPDEFKDRYLVIPGNCALNSVQVVENWAAFLAEHGIEIDLFGLPFKDAKTVVQFGIEQLYATKNVVKQDQKELAEYIASAVLKNETAQHYIQQIGATQVPIGYESFGWTWRGKKDAEADDFIMDMKLTIAANEKDFSYQIRKMGYLYQAAIYTKGGESKKDFFFMGYDRSGEVVIMEIPVAYLVQAWEQLQYYMGQFDKMIFLDRFLWSQDFWTRNGVYQYR